MLSKSQREQYKKYSDIYKILANPVRLEILDILKKGETSVADLIKELKLRKANVSQHLALLKYADLIVPRRDGLTVYYKLTQPKITELSSILDKIKD